jgi:hypothetical protein
LGCRYIGRLGAQEKVAEPRVLLTTDLLGTSSSTRMCLFTWGSSDFEPKSHVSGLRSSNQGAMVYFCCLHCIVAYTLAECVAGCRLDHTWTFRALVICRTITGCSLSLNNTGQFVSIRLNTSPIGIGIMNGSVRSSKVCQSCLFGCFNLGHGSSVAAENIKPHVESEPWLRCHSFRNEFRLQASCPSFASMEHHMPGMGCIL